MEKHLRHAYNNHKFGSVSLAEAAPQVGQNTSEEEREFPTIQSPTTYVPRRSSRSKKTNPKFRHCSVIQFTEAELNKAKGILTLPEIEYMLTMINEYEKGNEVPSTLQEAIASRGKDSVKADYIWLKDVCEEDKNRTCNRLKQVNCQVPEEEHEPGLSSDDDVFTEPVAKTFSNTHTKDFSLCPRKSNRTKKANKRMEVQTTYQTYSKENVGSMRISLLLQKAPSSYQIEPSPFLSSNFLCCVLRMHPTPTNLTRSQAIWHSRLGSALRTTLACTIVGCITLFGPLSLQRLLAFPALSYVVVILIVSEATLGEALRGFWYAIFGTIQGSIPAFLSLWVIGPARFSVSTIVLTVTLSTFVVALPQSTHVISKRIALAQIVMVYVVTSVHGVHTGAIIHPVHVAASAMVGALASVMALLIPYPRFSCYEVKDRCKLFKENASQRLNHYANALCADDNSSAVASLSQAKALAKTGSTILQNIKLKQESIQWERPQCRWSQAQYGTPIDRLQALENSLRGMEIALTSTTSCLVTVADQDLRDHLLRLKENIILSLKRCNFSKHSSTVSKSTEEGFDSSLLIFPTQDDLPSLFFLFCMKLFHNQLIYGQSVKKTAKDKLAPTVEETTNSPKQGKFTIKEFLGGWHANISTGRLIIALKCSLSLGFAVLFGMMYSREDGFWSGLTVGTAMAFTREATFKIANLKAQGTVLGTIYGVLSHFVFQKYLEIRFLTLLPWIVFTSFLRRSQMYGQAGANSAVIAALIILGRKNFGPPTEFAIVRITEAFIGLCCSITVELLIQPTRASTLAKIQLAHSLKALHGCVDSVFLHVGHGNNIRSSLSQLNEMEKKLKFHVNKLDNFIIEAENEPSFWFLPFHSVSYGKLLGSLTKMAELLYFTNHAMGFLEKQLQQSEDTLKKLHKSTDGDLDLFKKHVGSSLKCFEEVVSIKSLAALDKEINARGITYDLELGKSSNANEFKFFTADVVDAVEKITNSFVEHSTEFVAKFQEIEEDEELKDQIVLYLSALGFCMGELMTETRELEKSVKELIQWENPSSNINLCEIHCKIKALQS